jgi:hypothetical protein
MDEFATADQEVKKQNRRAWRIFAGMFTVLLGLLVFVVFKDEPPPDNAWLLPKFMPEGGERNPLVVFIEAVQAHRVNGYNDLLRAAQDHQEGQEPAMQAFVHRNSSSIAALDALLETDPSLCRWPCGEAKDGIMAKLPFLSQFTGVASDYFSER